MYDILFMANLVTAIFLVLVAWFIYRYSSLFPEIEKYWMVISVGFLVLAAGHFAEMLESLGLIGNYGVPGSVLGGCLLLAGFYRLYVSHKV